MAMDRTAYRLVSIRTKMRKKLAEVDQLFDQMDDLLKAQTGGKLENFKPGKALAQAKAKLGGGRKPAVKPAAKGGPKAKQPVVKNPVKKPVAKKAVPKGASKTTAKPKASSKPKPAPAPAAETQVDPLS